MMRDSFLFLGLMLLGTLSYGQNVFAYVPDSQEVEEDVIQLQELPSIKKLVVTKVTLENELHEVTCYPMTQQGLIWTVFAHDQAFTYQLESDEGTVTQGDLDYGKPISVSALAEGLYTLKMLNDKKELVGTYQIDLTK